MGRSPQDCVQVVRALDLLQAPIVWHIQGYVAGVASGQRSFAPDAAADLLLDEIVIGHQQYQQAINASTAFRRAFSEVFRRRSLLFVGSGLAESYFVNLIAESLFALGPSAMPHFALFSAADIEKNDPEFLAVRLGITPIKYGESHADLPKAIERIVSERKRTMVGSRGQFQMPSPLLSTLTYSVTRAGAAPGGDPVVTPVTLTFGHVPKPPKGTCVALSVGLDMTFRPPRPRIGPMVRNFYEAHHRPWDNNIGMRGFPPRCADESWLFEPANEPSPSAILLAAARDDTSQVTDTRSLESISRATVTALRYVERGGAFQDVVMG